MKYKNYKPTIHNFAHSFMSIDFTKSARFAVNTLIDLYNIKKEPKVTFNFINKKIHPIEAQTKESWQLLNDYMDWLPEHFEKHNCDLTKLEILEVTIWTDFDKATTPQGMNNAIQFTVNALTKWKADRKDEQIIELSQTELIRKAYLKFRIPEVN